MDTKSCPFSGRDFFPKHILPYFQISCPENGHEIVSIFWTRFWPAFLIPKCPKLEISAAISDISLAPFLISIWITFQASFWVHFWTRFVQLLTAFLDVNSDRISNSISHPNFSPIWHSHAQICMTHHASHDFLRPLTNSKPKAQQHHTYTRHRNHSSRILQLKSVLWNHRIHSQQHLHNMEQNRFGKTWCHTLCHTLRDISLCPKQCPPYGQKTTPFSIARPSTVNQTTIWVLIGNKLMIIQQAGKWTVSKTASGCQVPRYFNYVGPHDLTWRIYYREMHHFKATQSQLTKPHSQQAKMPKPIQQRSRDNLIPGTSITAHSGWQRKILRAWARDAVAPVKFGLFFEASFLCFQTNEQIDKTYTPTNTHSQPTHKHTLTNQQSRNWDIKNNKLTNQAGFSTSSSTLLSSSSSSCLASPKRRARLCLKPEMKEERKQNRNRAHASRRLRQIQTTGPTSRQTVKLNRNRKQNHHPKKLSPTSSRTNSISSSFSPCFWCNSHSCTQLLMTQSLKHSLAHIRLSHSQPLALAVFLVLTVIAKRDVRFLANYNLPTEFQNQPMTPPCFSHEYKTPKTHHSMKAASNARVMLPHIFHTWKRKYFKKTNHNQLAQGNPKQRFRKTLPKYTCSPSILYFPSILQYDFHACEKTKNLHESSWNRRARSELKNCVFAKLIPVEFRCTLLSFASSYLFPKRKQSVCEVCRQNLTTERCRLLPRTARILKFNNKSTLFANSATRIATAHQQHQNYSHSILDKIRISHTTCRSPHNCWPRHELCSKMETSGGAQKNQVCTNIVPDWQCAFTATPVALQKKSQLCIRRIRKIDTSHTLFTVILSSHFNSLDINAHSPLTHFDSQLTYLSLTSNSPLTHVTITLTHFSLSVSRPLRLWSLALAFSLSRSPGLSVSHSLALQSRGLLVSRPPLSVSGPLGLSISDLSSRRSFGLSVSRSLGFSVSHSLNILLFLSLGLLLSRFILSVSVSWSPALSDSHSLRSVALLLSISHSLGRSIARPSVAWSLALGLSVSQSLGLSVSRSLSLSVSRSLNLEVSQSLGLSVLNSASFELSIPRSLELSISRSLGLYVSWFLDIELWWAHTVSKCSCG